MRRTGLGLVMIIMLLVAACSPAPEPTPQPAATLPPPTEAPVTVIVTLPPIPTETPTPTPTPLFDVGPYQGQWQLDFWYELTSVGALDEVRLSGAVPFQVTDDDGVVGYGTLTVGVARENCVVSAQEPAVIPVTLTGDFSRQGGVLSLIFSLRPDDPEYVPRYALSCLGGETVTVSQQFLWPALEALGVQPYILPLEPGANTFTTNDLNGYPNLAGTLETEIRLRR